MTSKWTPMRWPPSWKDPAALNLLKGTPIDCLLIEKREAPQSVLDGAQKSGLKILDAAAAPTGVIIIKGVWPGVKLTQSGAVDRASAGPTGAPWVDSNGWRVRLAAIQRPGNEIWVEANPEPPRLFPESYLIGLADAAAHGGRWIISLDNRLATELAARKPEAAATWQKITGAAGFFAAHTEWAKHLPEAALGIVSDFAGSNEFMSHELLNLVARTNQQYRIIPKNKAGDSSFLGLKAVLYADDQPPSQGLRDSMLAFVRAGGMLITGPAWGPITGTSAGEQDHPRYSLYVLGKGRLAVARPDFDDPYMAANDAAILISHRHDLIRFWNGGSVGSYLTMHSNRKRAVLHMLFYAANYFGTVTVWVAGRYRDARLWTPGGTAPAGVGMERQRDGTELHLPPISQYAALELEV